MYPYRSCMTSWSWQGQIYLPKISNNNMADTRNVEGWSDTRAPFIIRSLNFIWTGGARGLHAVAQLVEALLYKPKGRGFDSRWCHWNFSLTHSFQPDYGPRVDSASKRKEYQEYLLGGQSGRTLPCSCAECLEIWEPQTPGTLRACRGL
jgi:hypothetical protein